jgi:trigger factor
MQITHETTGGLNALIRIEFSPEDYQPKIDAQLREYSKKVSMPGFRPGKVPSGMVKKMYGKSILVDELNKLTSDSLMGYIRDTQLDILGNPLPADANDNSLDLDNPGTIKLAFEIGLAPQFSLEISSNQAFSLYAPLIDNDFVSKEVENYRERLGDYTEVEVSVDGDIVHGIFKELDAEGNEVDGGISKHTDIHDADLKEGNAKAFEGLKKGDAISVNMKETFGNTKVIAAILGISDEQAGLLELPFRFEVESVKRKGAAELNQEFFDKLFGKDVIFNEEELRERIARDAAERFRKDSEARFFNEVVEGLVNQSNFELPDEFLKRWLRANNDGKVEENDIDENYTKYARGIRWQLIENKIIRDFNIQVTREQAIESVATEFMAYMGGIEFSSDEQRARINQIAEQMLQNEKEANRIYGRLFNEAMNGVFLENFSVNRIEMPFDDWAKKVSEPLNS